MKAPLKTEINGLIFYSMFAYNVKDKLSFSLSRILV